MGLWGPALGGRVFRFGHEVLTQQEAELDSLVQGLSCIVNVGWPVFRLVGDNASSIGQMAGMRARSGLKRHNRNLRRTFYLLQRSDSTVFLEWVPGNLNPADCFSRIDGGFGGDFAAVGSAAWDRFRSLQAFLALPCPAWVANLPKEHCYGPPACRMSCGGCLLVFGGTLRRAGCWGPLATFRRVPRVLLPVEALPSVRDLAQHGCFPLPVPVFLF